jgi:peptide/nickel transport system permease protein
MNRLASRLAWSAFVVWAVVSITFVVQTVLPGDPARMVAGAQARPADIARIRARLGLDRSLPEQYVRFWTRLVHVGPRQAREAADHTSCAVALPLGAARAVHVDFGKSFQMSQPVVDVLLARMPRTFALAIVAMALQLLFGVGTGVVAAMKRDSWLDRVLVSASLLGLSVPTFLIALGLQLLFARSLRWLPLDGFGADLAEHGRSMVLPALTLGIYGAAYYTRLVRDEMIVLMRSDWVRTARAKGLPEWRIVVTHALRNALVPVVTAAGLDLGALLGGAIVTETVFRWPGLGELSVKAMLNRDGPVIAACVIVTSVAIVGANVVVDFAYTRLDPRVTGRREGGTR